MGARAVIAHYLAKIFPFREKKKLAVIHSITPKKIQKNVNLGRADVIIHHTDNLTTQEIIQGTLEYDLDMHIEEINNQMLYAGFLSFMNNLKQRKYFNKTHIKLLTIHPYNDIKLVTYEE